MQLKSSEGAARDFGYTPDDFERARALIHARAGISLADSKHDMVYSRLGRRVRALDLASIGEYLDQLEAADDPAEWQEFTNALTTNLTAFFREPHHFDALKKHLASLPPGRPARIWCSAASTGEEPYSLAMTVCEHYGTLTPPVRILATDIDTQVLATGERGVYPLERIARLDPERVKSFFRRGAGAHEGQCRVIPELQELLVFRPLNLLDPAWPLRGPLDAIFCRNVMIYFDKPTQRGILEKFRPLLQPEGLLFAGHSESFLHASDLFKSVGRTIYRRADAA